jgi:hypothetical protein
MKAASTPYVLFSGGTDANRSLAWPTWPPIAPVNDDQRSFEPPEKMPDRETRPSQDRLKPNIPDCVIP